MDVSLKARSFDKYESLVFNLDVQYDHDTRTVDYFLAEVYEEAPEVFDKKIELWIVIAFLTVSAKEPDVVHIDPVRRM